MASPSATPTADRALKAMRRGLAIAHDSGNRSNESHLAAIWPGSKRNVATRSPRSTTSVWRSATIHESGNIAHIRSPLTVLAIFLDRLGRYEPAATIAGFALSPLSAATFPNINTAITHLRDVLGDQAYESLARKGETMTTAEIVAYAYDQIDQARTELTLSRNRTHLRHSSNPNRDFARRDVSEVSSQQRVSSSAVA